MDLNKGSQIRQIFKDDVLDVIDALEDIKTQSTVNLKESKISIEDWDQDLILKRAFEIFRGDDDTVFNSEAMEKVGLLIDSQTIKLPKGTILKYEGIGGYNTPSAIYSLPQYNNVKIKIYWDFWEEDLSKAVKILDVPLKLEEAFAYPTGKLEGEIKIRDNNFYFEIENEEYGNFPYIRGYCDMKSRSHSNRYDLSPLELWETGFTIDLENFEDRPFSSIDEMKFTIYDNEKDTPYDINHIYGINKKLDLLIFEILNTYMGIINNEEYESLKTKNKKQSQLNHLKESVTNYDVAFIDVSGSNSGPKMIKVSEKLAKDAGAQKLMYFAGKIGKTPEEAFSNGTYYEPIKKYLNDNNISKAIVVTDEDVEMNEDGKDLQKDSRVTIIRNDEYRYDPEAFLNGTFDDVRKSIPHVIDKTSKTDKMTNREKLQKVFSKGLKESYNEAQYEYQIFVNNEVLDDYFEGKDLAYAKAEELKRSKYYNGEKIYKIELWRAPLGELDGELYDMILDESYNNVKLNQLKESLGSDKFNKIQSLINECLKEGMEVEITIPKKKLLKEGFKDEPDLIAILSIGYSKYPDIKPYRVKLYKNSHKQNEYLFDIPREEFTGVFDSIATTKEQLLKDLLNCRDIDGDTIIKTTWGKNIELN